MGFTTEINDPLAPLRENPVSEEIIRPLSELLITDPLVTADCLSHRYLSYEISATLLIVADGARSVLSPVIVAQNFCESAETQ